MTDTATQPTVQRYPLGPCRGCGTYGPDVDYFPHVRSGSERTPSYVVDQNGVFACPEHAEPYLARCGDPEWLAKRRAADSG